MSLNGTHSTLVKAKVYCGIITSKRYSISHEKWLRVGRYSESMLARRAENIEVRVTNVPPDYNQKPPLVTADNYHTCGVFVDQMPNNMITRIPCMSAKGRYVIVLSKKTNGLRMMRVCEVEVYVLRECHPYLWINNIDKCHSFNAVTFSAKTTLQFVYWNLLY